MFDKIVVATDGSVNAQLAVKHAAEIARMAKNPEVMVVHVCPGCTALLDPEGSNRRLAQEIVDKAVELFNNTGASVRALIEIDYPPESLGSAIVDIAKREQANLIVVGSRGLSEFRGMLLGSVSSKVVQHASCPVLIVKSDELKLPAT